MFVSVYVKEFRCANLCKPFMIIKNTQYNKTKSLKTLKYFVNASFFLIANSGNDSKINTV